MAIRATLKIANMDDIDILKCEYALHRDVDSNGELSSGANVFTITLAIETTRDNTIVESMVNDERIDCVVSFYDRDTDSKIKEVSWQKGHIINYREGMDVIGTSQMQTDFTVSAEKFRIC